MTIVEQNFGIAAGGPNAGYIRTLWLIRETDVVAVLEPESIALTVRDSGLLVRPGAVVARLQPPARTATFEEPGLNERAGRVYQPSLQLSLPRPTAELDEYLTQNQTLRWLAFWLDYNNQGWLAGEPGNGLRLALLRKQADTQQINLQLTGKSSHPAWRLETTDLARLFPAADFDFSFELSFNS